MTGPARRVAVVTGGAGAIGGSVAAALTAADHQVLILDRTGDVPVDLADEQQVRAAAQRSWTRPAAAMCWSTRRPRSTGPTWPAWT